MAGSCVGASTSDPAILCILGPTASGKTGLSLELAERFNGEIVVMDSAQVYQGLQIGSAKPTPAEVSRVPHHLLGTFAWADVCSAARWADCARAAITDIHQRGRLPILCGGTFLYLRALLEGLHPLPTDDRSLRDELEQRAQREGVPALHAELARKDPLTAARIHPNDTQRTLRALEILAQSGQGREALIASQRPACSWDGPVLKLALMPGTREALRARIATRFHAMLDEGLWQEVRAVYQDPEFDPDLPVLKAVGYRQLFAALDGRLSEDEAVERAIIATRQYAKRQLTWLRGDSSLHWIDSSSADATQEAVAQVEQWLGSRGSANSSGTSRSEETGRP